MSSKALPSPTIDQFAEELVKEPRWYDLGIFLGVPTHELDNIGLNYRQEGTMRCLIEMYKCLVSRQKLRSWEDIAEALSRINNEYLSHHIKQKYLGIAPPNQKAPPSPELTIVVAKKITSEFQQVHSAFITLELEVKKALRITDVHLEDLRFVFMEYCEMEEMTEELTVDKLFLKLRHHYCFLNYQVLTDVSERFLSNNNQLKKFFIAYEEQLDKFKESTELRSLMDQINENLTPDQNQKIINLEIQEFWGTRLISKFEKLLKQIFKQKYKALSNIRVEKGCIHVSWLVSMKHIDDLVKQTDSSEVLLKAVGVISITVDDRVLYKENTVGCEVIDSSLLQAVKDGNPTAVDILVFAGGDPNTSQVKGITPLMIASNNNNQELVQLILTFSVNINATSKSGLTAIYKASRHGHTDVVALLLEAGADLNMAENKGWTPLMTASYRGHAEIVKLLVEVKVNVNATAKSGQTAIYKASLHGRTEVVYLLLKAGADPNMPDNIGWTPLMAASDRGHIEVAQLLLKANVDINAKAKKGEAAIHVASRHGHTDVVYLLLEAGAVPNMAENKGWTPLMTASYRGHVVVAQLLLKVIVNVNATAKSGQTAIYKGSLNGYTDVVSLLLGAGADPNMPDNKGWTPLMAASNGGHVEVVQLLLKANVNFNAKAKNSEAAMHVASQCGHTDVVYLLLEAGADPNMPDNKGWTPLMAASNRGHVEVVQLLLKANVNFNATSRTGRSAIYIASQRGHTDIVCLLLEAGADQADARDDTLFRKMMLHKHSHDDKGITVSQWSASLLSVATLDSVTTADTGIYSRSGRDSDDESCLIVSEDGVDDLLSSEEEAPAS